ncbi:MAG TPA: hypothetical protein VF135_10540, partial [Terriglobales bacterium]
MNLRILRIGTGFVLLFGTLCLLAQDSPAPAANGKAKAPNAVQAAPQQSEFSESVAAQLMGQIRDGLHSHSSRRMLTAFDRDKMPNYLVFEDDVRAFFNQYGSFRSYFRILQSSVENDRGVILANWQIEASPDSGGPPERRDEQVRFECAQGSNGWRIVEL